MEMEDKGLTILIRKLLNYTDFLLLHDGSVGQVGLDGCPLKQDYTTPHVEVAIRPRDRILLG